VAEALVRLVDVVRAVDVVLVRDVVHALRIEHSIHVVHPRRLARARRRHDVEARVIQERVSVGVVAAAVRDALAERAAQARAGGDCGRLRERALETAEHQGEQRGQLHVHLRSPRQIFYPFALKLGALETLDLVYMQQSRKWEVCFVGHDAFYFRHRRIQEHLDGR